MTRKRRASSVRASHPTRRRFEAPAVQQHQVPAAAADLEVRALTPRRCAPVRRRARVRATSSSTCCLGVRGGQRDPQARAAGGHGGRADGHDRTAPPPAARACAARAAAALPSSTGWMGVAESMSGTPAALRQLAEARDVRVQRARAASPRCCSQRERGAARGRHRLRQRRRIDIGARRLDQELDELGRRRRRRRRRSRRPCRACRRAPAPARASSPKCSSVPRPLAPDDAQAVRVVHDEPGVRCARAARASCGSGARSPSMLNTPSVAMQRRACGAPAPSSCRGGRASAWA